VDDSSSTLVVAGPEGEIPILVAFAEASGYPTWIEADRYKARGAKIRWRGTFAEWRRFGGVLAPGRFTAAWADEPRPWIAIRTRAVRVDVPIDDALALARRALAAHA
jgi:hypothetical protein